MKRSVITILAASLVAAAPLATFAAPNAQDLTFAKMAAQGGMAEVGEATLAQKNGSSSAVKSFAAKMLADHGKANAELTSIAKSEHVALPTDIGRVNTKAKGSLENLHGTTFDTAYLQDQRVAHVQTAALFTKEIANGSDAKLVAFAKMTLPTVNAHIAMDRKDLGAMGSMTSPGGSHDKKSSM